MVTSMPACERCGQPMVKFKRGTTINGVKQRVVDYGCGVWRCLENLSASR